MNLPEFKAWFEGFTEAMTGPPNKTQWKRIQAKIAEITPNPTPWATIVREYVPHYWPRYVSLPYSGPIAPTFVSNSVGASSNDMTCKFGADTSLNFTMVDDAFRAMGQVDFAGLN